MTGADRKMSMVLDPIEQIAGFALSMALSDLQSGYRIEPDLFSVASDGSVRVSQPEADDYIEAIETSLSLVDTKLSEGAAICAFAYQGSTTTDAGRHESILVRCVWQTGLEVMVSVPFFMTGDQLSSIGRCEFDVVSEGASPDVLPTDFEEAVLSGIGRFPKGAAVWSAMQVNQPT